MGFLIKWIVIIGSAIWAGVYLYPKIDAYIDIKKTITSIKHDVHDAIRTNSTDGNKDQQNNSE